MKIDMDQLLNYINMNLHELSITIGYNYPNLHKIAKQERLMSMNLFLALVDKLGLEANKILEFRV